jgi:hypothetical protein
MSDKESKKYIIISTTKDFHAEIKKRAAIRGISIKVYITRALLEQIKKEKQYDK